MAPNTSRQPAISFPLAAAGVQSKIFTASDSGNSPGEMQVGETTEVRERRRIQNRLAQQAFRARQKVRVEALESEWAQLRQLHEALNLAYSQQTKEIKELQARVQELLQDIDVLKNAQEIERNWSSPPTTPEQQYLLASALTVAEAELRSVFIEGGLSDFPDFPESFRSHYSI